MAESTSNLLRFQHDLHIAQAICDRTACQILVFEIPSGQLFYINAVAREYLENRHLPSVAGRSLAQASLREILSGNTWRAWLDTAEIVDRTGEPISSFDTARFVHTETLPVYPRVVARCNISFRQMVPDPREGHLTS